MSQWLVDNYEGEWHGRHHEWKVPDECRDFLVFTLIRKPYEIQASGWFFKPVIKAEDAPPKPETYAESARAWVPLDNQPVSQKDFVDYSGISQVLYFEHLPECLAELPFVDSTNIPPFPYLNAGGYRPEGTFLDLMSDEDEQLVWEGGQSDFEFFGYERYGCGAPNTVNKSLHWTAQKRRPLAQRSSK